MSAVVFSVIIPSYNEAANIRRCLVSVLANDKDTGYEIVVIDHGSSDGTTEIVKALGIRLIEISDRNKTIGALRNIGARHTRGPVLVFLDSDMLVPQDLFKKAQHYFDGGYTGALGFSCGVPQEAGWVGRVWGARLYQRLDRISNVDYLSGNNIFINRRVFEEINGFDETLETNEDKDMTMRVKRAGYSLTSIPETDLLHLGHEKNLREFIIKEFWRQGSSLKAAIHYGLSLKTLRHPFFSLFHIVMPLSIIFSSFLLSSSVSLVLLIVWILPSAVIAVKKLGPTTPVGFRTAFFFLTFLRWNVSGAAILKQAIIFLPCRKNVKHK